MASRRHASRPFAEILGARLRRRSLLKVAAASVPLAYSASALSCLPGADTDSGVSLAFEPIAPNSDDTVTVADGYRARPLISWGDPVLDDAPAFDINAQTPAAQARQFGYNSDFIAFLPLPDARDPAADRGLLWNNHEYINPELMFPGYDPEAPTREQVDIGILAHGASIVELRLVDGEWTTVRNSRFNRRITGETLMNIRGPAAGDDRLRTADDPSGAVARGMLNNCGGGVTPWGTVLTDEEDFFEYFGNRPEGGPHAEVHRRYQIPTGDSVYLWERHRDRFDVSKTPNEVFRTGYVVEVDPYDPASTPTKLTALGRFRHEASSVTLAPDGRVVVYSGDDDRFEYVYRFISRRTYDPSDRAANMTLLHRGALAAARYNDDGSGEWIPLVAGQGPLADWSPADVAVNTRGAADLVGATPMDRPEDVEVNPVNGRIYAAFTKNKQRTADQVDAANPRADNRYGHVIEMAPTGGDHSASTFDWEILFLGGDPANPEHAISAAGIEPAPVAPLANPDNVLFDPRGVLYVCTDGQPSALGVNDGLFGVPVSGPDRGRARQLLSVPVGAELASGYFTPDGRWFFGAVQHPGEESTLAAPSSSYPGGPGTPPRPGVFAVNKIDGGPIGT